MPDSFAQSHAEVESLVDIFEKNLESYLQPSYNESQARTDFIDKFFIALGWDVKHDEQTNPYEQEVKVERGVAVAERRKKADYAFFLKPDFASERFFVEAKRPASELGTLDNCFQIIRYAYSSSRAALSILTNFNELYVMDCRFQPDVETATAQIHRKFHFTDFRDASKFGEVYYLFSREAVASGRLDQYALQLPRPKGKVKQRRLFKDNFQEIDEGFLQKLEEYREELAKMFKRRNYDLTSEDLTEAVQRTLDRLVFIRFLEDKLIEPSTILDKLGEKPNAWKEFVARSRAFDKTYNGIIFKEHRIIDSPDFVADDRVFVGVVDDFADKYSPYHFNYIPIHILGSIYERFLGNVIVAKPRTAVVEKKPEVRRVGGVFYTPQYVVNYIVENTVGKLLEGKTPKDVEEMRFADIACGSGSFLLGVFDYLIRWHTAYYNQKRRKKEAHEAGCVEHDDGTFHLSFEQKREILTNNIYGVDIDRQAFEVTQLSLFLKLLDEETLGSIQPKLGGLRQGLLPSLTGNIVCGNALVEEDVTSGNLLEQIDQETEKSLNPMNFERRFKAIMDEGGFDVIVGNPPYDVLEKERESSREENPDRKVRKKQKERIVINYHAPLIKYVQKKADYAAALGGKLNLYRLFLVRAIQLTKKNGRIGMIIPLSLLGDISCASTRRYFLNNLTGVWLDCFPQKDNPKRRIFRDAKLSTMVYSGEVSVTEPGSDSAIYVRVFPGNSFEEPYKDNTINVSDLSLVDKRGWSVPLVNTEDWDLCRKLYREATVIPVGDCDSFAVNRGEINQTTYRKYINSNPLGARLVKGVEIGQYQVHSVLSQGFREWFDEAQFLKKFPYRPLVDKTRIATQRITGVDEQLRLVATLIFPKAYFADSVNSISVTDRSRYRIEYMLGLINSNLFQWRFKITSTNNNVGTN